MGVEAVSKLASCGAKGKEPLGFLLTNILRHLGLYFFWVRSGFWTLGLIWVIVL